MRGSIHKYALYKHLQPPQLQEGNWGLRAMDGNSYILAINQIPAKNSFIES